VGRLVWRNGLKVWSLGGWLSRGRSYGRRCRFGSLLLGPIVGGVMRLCLGFG
jgi:hypothetical protein